MEVMKLLDGFKAKDFVVKLGDVNIGRGGLHDNEIAFFSNRTSGEQH